MTKIPAYLFDDPALGGCRSAYVKPASTSLRNSPAWLAALDRIEHPVMETVANFWERVYAAIV